MCSWHRKANQAYICNLSLTKLRQKDHCEFMASLGYQ